MSEPTRDQRINGLRALADALGSHPDLPVPDIYITVYANVAEGRKIRSQLHGWSKTNHAHASYVSYMQQFCEDSDQWGGIQYIVEVSKRETCERVQVSTRHVEAVEAHDEPVYEWVCEQ